MYPSSMVDVLFDAHFDSTLRAFEAAMAHGRLAHLVIQAGEPRLAFQDDQTLSWRSNPWFNWLVPLRPPPGSLLELKAGRRPRLLYVAPDDYWHLPPEVPDGAWTTHFDIEVVPSASAALSALRREKQPSAWIGESGPAADWPINPAALLDELVQARCRKSAYEVACLREATRIAVHGHRAAEQAFRDGASELDIHLAFLAATRCGESDLPYPAIIALNEHGATLHYQLRDAESPARSLSLLIDAGTSQRHYGCDITRTHAMVPGIFASLIEGMNTLQQALCEAVAPGVDWRELHLRAHHLIARLLTEAGVLNNLSAEAAVASGVSSVFMPHGLGHLLGLQVHDVGGFVPRAGADPIPRPDGHPALRLTRRLEAGMVVTVEPGLYFIDSLLQKLRTAPEAGAVNWLLVDSLRACGGIRIEDNVLVTANGGNNLTRPAFADMP